MPLRASGKAGSIHLYSRDYGFRGSAARGGVTITETDDELIDNNRVQHTNAPLRTQEFGEASRQCTMPLYQISYSLVSQRL